MNTLLFGAASTVWLMLSALYVFLIDRRYCARRVVATAIIVHIAIIAFHYMVDPFQLAMLMMPIEAVFAYRVSVSEFPLRKTFALLLSGSVVLSLAWGWDISHGCLYLCDGEEPSNYRILSGVLTILNGIVFVGGEHFGERIGATYFDVLSFRGYHRRGGR